MFHTWRGLDICVYNDLACNYYRWKMIDIATLSILKKQKLQRILEINKPITYASFPSASDMTP
jgi:hypothetical protein